MQNNTSLQIGPAYERERMMWRCAWRYGVDLLLSVPEAHLERIQTSNMEVFTKYWTGESCLLFRK